MLVSKLIDGMREGEEGHAGPLPAMFVGAAGAILLAIGAAADIGWLDIVGGVVLALGFVGAFVMHHMLVEYDIMGRLDTLEKK